MQDPLLQLSLLCAPFGVKVVSTGTSEVGKFLAARYGENVQDAFERNLQQIATAKVVILGAPNDTGAGFLRGSKLGPLALRKYFLENGWYGNWDRHGVVDIGDSREHPLCQHDSMLQPWVLEAIRKERWPSYEHLDLPVSTHSVLERVLDCIYALNPKVRILLLGGDHSLSLLPVQALVKRKETFGILHFDAHTDLLASRDGMQHSYATWAYWANEAIGRGKKLIQVGIRTSGRTKEHWEHSLYIHQFWRDSATSAQIVQYFKDAGVDKLYISNDVDALDPQYVSATGTAEEGGLTPDYVREIIQACAREFTILGSDVMELAPSLGARISEEPARSVAIAAQFCKLQIESMLG